MRERRNVGGRPAAGERECELEMTGDMLYVSKYRMAGRGHFRPWREGRPLALSAGARACKDGRESRRARLLLRSRLRSIGCLAHHPTMSSER